MSQAVIRLGSTALQCWGCYCWSDLGLLPKERLLLTLAVQKPTGWWECRGLGGKGRLGLAAVLEGCLLL